MPYAVEEWFDGPDAERIKRDGALAASRLESSSVIFPYAASQVRGAQAALKASQAAAAAARAPKPKSLRQQAFDAVDAQQKKAFEATQARIDEAKLGYKERRDRALSSLSKKSKGDEADVKRRWDEVIAERKAAAVRSGMVNTPAWTSEYKGLLAQRDRELRNVGDARLNAEMGVDLSTSKDQLDFLGSIDDVGPDTSAYLKLAELEGSGTTEGLDPNAFGNPLAGAPIMPFGTYGIQAPQQPGYGGPVGGYGPQATTAKAAAPTLGQLRNMDPVTYAAKYGKVQTHGPNASPLPGVPTNPFRNAAPAQPMVSLPPVSSPVAPSRPITVPPLSVPHTKPLTYAPDVGTYTPPRPIVPTPMRGGATMAPAPVMPGYTPDMLPPGFTDFPYWLK